MNNNINWIDGLQIKWRLRLIKDKMKIYFWRHMEGTALQHFA